jgi:hypothetical protein
LPQLATWDDRLLAQQLKDPASRLGEIDLRIASLEGSAEREDDPADLLPDLPMTPAGHHRRTGHLRLRHHLALQCFGILPTLRLLSVH